MFKTYGEIAMDVVREDWAYRDPKNNPLISRRSVAKCLSTTPYRLEKSIFVIQNPTISFLCGYATAAGIPISAFLHKIGLLAEIENRIFAGSMEWEEMSEEQKGIRIENIRKDIMKNCPDLTVYDRKRFDIDFSVYS